MEEAHAAPVVVFDVLRVAALTHGLVGQSVSLASVARDLLNLVLPKALAVSDWGAEPLSRAQLLYSALDAVVTFLDPSGARTRALPPGPSAAPSHGRVRRPRLRDGARRDSARSRPSSGANRRMERQASAVSATRSARSAAAAISRPSPVCRTISTPSCRPEERETWPTTPTGKLSTAKLISQAQSASARDRRAARTARSENARFDLRRGSL